MAVDAQGALSLGRPNGGVGCAPEIRSGHAPRDRAAKATGPHLHFAILDSPDTFTGTSIPFVIDTWTLQGTAVWANRPTAVQVTGPASAQHNTHPLVNTVADFGG